MISFTSIHVEGFGSFIQPFDFTFANEGLHLIKGNNGAGKTTLFSALAWAIYKQTLKNKGTVETWPSLRDKSFMGTVVDLVFQKEETIYRVIRFKDYRAEYETFGKGADRLILLVNGSEFKKFKDKNDLNNKVLEIMGVSFKLFKTSVLFGQKIKRLMEEDGSTKKELFEEAFDASFINPIKAKLEDSLKDKESSLKVLYAGIDGLNRELKAVRDNITTTTELLETALENQSTAKAKLKAEIFSTKQLIKETQDQLNTLGDWEAPVENPTNIYKLTKLEYEATTKKVNKFTEMRGDLKKTIEKAEADLEKATKSKVCPTCGQKFTADGHRDHVNDLTLLISTSKQQLADTNKALNGQLKQQSSILKTLDAYKLQVDKFEKLEDTKSQGEFLKKALEKHKKTLKSLKEKPEEDNTNMVASLEKSLEQYKIRRAELKKAIAKKDKEIAHEEKQRDIDKWLITTPLSNSGLKAYIFSYKLGALNDRLSYYSQFIGFKPSFSVDMASARKDIVAQITRGDEVVPFDDLSGGQGQLVNVATAFATHDIVVGDSAFNILILDEIFENLDENNIDIVTDLIAAKTGKKVVYLITHHKDFTPTGACVLEFALKKGCTVTA